MDKSLQNPIFANKRLNPAKLAAFGFEGWQGGYIYRRAIAIGDTGEHFEMTVQLDSQGAVQTQLVDADGGEYVLHRSEAVAGAFVGAVRAAHDAVLQQIADSCFDQAIFKAPQTLALIEHVRKAYGDELEFLWAKLPQAAIWRREPSRKWYGAIMAIGRDKLGFKGDEELVEIIDLHCRAEDMAGRLAAGALPGYHMNKKYWFTVVLDGSVELAVIQDWLRSSWELAGSKTSKKSQA